MKIQKIGYKFEGDVYTEVDRSEWNTIGYDEMIDTIYELHERLKGKPYLTCSDIDLEIVIVGVDPQKETLAKYTIKFDPTIEDQDNYRAWHMWQTKA